jgi:hypothetical protein
VLPSAPIVTDIRLGDLLCNCRHAVVIELNPSNLVDVPACRPPPDPPTLRAEEQQTPIEPPIDALVFEVQLLTNAIFAPPTSDLLETEV